MKAPAQVEVED